VTHFLDEHAVHSHVATGARGRLEHFRSVSPPDSLTHLLTHFRIAGVALCWSDLAAVWDIDIASEQGEAFHYVQAGGAWLSCGKQQTWLAQGDLCLVTQGQSHRLSSAASGSVPGPISRETLAPGVFRMRNGGDGPRTTLVCCRASILDGTPLLKMAPVPLVIRGESETGRALAPVLHLMATEAVQGGAGGAAVMGRLAEIVIAQVLRGWIASEQAESWIPAVSDPRLGRVLAQVHKEPGADWSLKKLAELANLSRSAFAERFQERLGVAPARYVTQLRMRVATRLLESQQISVAQAAQRLGYHSESAFARAYKRTCGHGPGAARRNPARS
jgi:AraC-like DNA-binding protein